MILFQNTISIQSRLDNGIPAIFTNEKKLEINGKSRENGELQGFGWFDEIFMPRHSVEKSSEHNVEIAEILSHAILAKIS